MGGWTLRAVSRGRGPAGRPRARPAAGMAAGIDRGSIGGRRKQRQSGHLRVWAASPGTRTRMESLLRFRLGMRHQAGRAAPRGTGASELGAVSEARSSPVLGESVEVVGAFARRSAAVLALLAVWAAPAAAQTIRDDFPLPNGLVYALAQGQGTLYVGGTFTRIGPRAAFGAALSPVTGEIVRVPKLDGPVGAAAPDGQGGWFIIGGFNDVDGVPRHGMAHVQADGTV